LLLRNHSTLLQKNFVWKQPSTVNRQLTTKKFMVLQVENNTYEAKTQEIAKQVLAATQENRSFLAALRDQMRWDD
jgi:hypothetical protein